MRRYGIARVLEYASQSRALPDEILPRKRMGGVSSAGEFNAGFFVSGKAPAGVSEGAYIGM